MKVRRQNEPKDMQSIIKLMKLLCKLCLFKPAAISRELKYASHLLRIKILNNLRCKISRLIEIRPNIKGQETTRNRDKIQGKFSKKSTELTKIISVTLQTDFIFMFNSS